MNYFLKKDWTKLKDSNNHLVETDEDITFDIVALKKLELMGKAKINSRVLEIYEPLRKRDTISGANLYNGNEQLRHCLITSTTDKQIECKWYSERDYGILSEKPVSLMIPDSLTAEGYLNTLEEAKVIAIANRETFVIINDDKFNKIAGIIDIDPGLELKSWFLNKNKRSLN